MISFFQYGILPLPHVLSKVYYDLYKFDVDNWPCEFYNPKWPGHSLKLEPHVLHLNPGSMTPSLISIKPPVNWIAFLIIKFWCDYFCRSLFLIIFGEKRPKTANRLL